MGFGCFSKCLISNKKIHSFSSKNKLYLLKIDFSVVRLSRSLVMISLLLSFVSSVLLPFLAGNIFLVFPLDSSNTERICVKERGKQNSIKKFRFFEKAKKIKHSSNTEKKTKKTKQLNTKSE